MSSDELKARALRLLARREYSRAELQKKLLPYGEPEAVEAVLERMDELGLQSDDRFAESYIRSKGARLGRRRLEQELAQRGIDRERIESALDAGLGDAELERARALWSRKYGAVPADAKEWARQARFLMARGFSTAVVRTVLKEPFDESA